MDFQLENANPAICGSLKGSTADQSITIPLDVDFILGRDDTCHFKFHHSFTHISPIHCKIASSLPRPSSPGVQLSFVAFLFSLSEDSETWVNDRKLPFGQMCQLHDRDLVSLGIKKTRQLLVLRFRLYDPQSIQALVEFGPTLGKGSFGEVLVVRGYRTKLLYAMKIIRDNECSLWNDPDHVVRREVEAMKCIDHPHIVYMFAYFIEAPFVFILTELCLCTVEDLIGSRQYQANFEQRALEQDPARVITYQTCLGLLYLHSINIVHRDVKPSNVMVSCLEPLTVKLGDFGTAKQTEGAGAKTCVGSPAYIAPEVAKAKSFKGAYDFKADSWSVGTMIFFMLSTSYPFHSKALRIGYIDERKEILWARFPHASHFENARDIIGKLLQLKPAHRLSMSDTIVHAWLCQRS